MRHLRVNYSWHDAKTQEEYVDTLSVVAADDYNKNPFFSDMVKHLAEDAAKLVSGVWTIIDSVDYYSIEP